MTISSAPHSHIFPAGPPVAPRAAESAEPADDAISNDSGAQSDYAEGQLRLAALLGIDPSTMRGVASDAARSGSSQKLAIAETNHGNIAPTASHAVNPASSVNPASTATTPLPPGTVRDVGGTTIAAGTVVDGMVSAGPLSAGLASMTGGVPPSTGTRLLAVATDAASFGYDPIAMIRDRLTKLGVDSGGITFERVTDDIETPGGNRTNQYVRATFGNGLKENFAVERVLQNPDIPAVEIKSLMARGFQPA